MKNVNNIFTFTAATIITVTGVNFIFADKGNNRGWDNVNRVFQKDIMMF